MSMTIIFSDFGDTDTQVLKALWENIENAKILHITRDTKNAESLVNAAIASEKGTLLFCGHGLPTGLLSPNWGLLLDKENAGLICAKRVIGIWCHAAQFAESVGLKGFFSSMFISNINEAFAQRCYDSTPSTITREEILFCQRVNALIRENTPTEKWCEILMGQADMNIDVVNFNYSGLKYFG